MGKRTAEFVLGLIGGILGFFASAISTFNAMGDGLNTVQIINIVDLAFVAMIFSIVGIVGASLVKSKPKPAGWLMIISAVIGVASIGFGYALSFILLIIAGLMAVIKKNEYNNVPNGNKTLKMGKEIIKLYIISILGVIGGILGLFYTFPQLIMGTLGTLLVSIPALKALTISLTEILFLILVIRGSYLVKIGKTKVGGRLMIVGAAGFGIIDIIGIKATIFLDDWSHSLLFSLIFSILLLIAGLVAINTKEKDK